MVCADMTAKISRTVMLSKRITKTIKDKCLCKIRTRHTEYSLF